MGLTPDGSMKEGILKQWEKSAETLQTDRVSVPLLLQSSQLADYFAGINLLAPRARHQHPNIRDHGRHPSSLPRREIRAGLSTLGPSSSRH